MSVHVMELVEIESSGRGTYHPSRKATRGHILVVGGGVTCGSQTVIEAFMHALCRNDKYYDTPDIVLMGQTACSKEVKEMLKSEWAMGYKLQYFIGCPLDAKDLIRVKANEASIVFILSDYLTSDTKTEDRENALIAAALRRLNPNVQYRLMLCSMNSRELSSNIGLSEFNCFSLETLKAGMLGTSLRCPGFSTLLLNLGLPDLPVPNTPFSTEIIPNCEHGQWLKEYAIGCSYEIYGFLPAPFLVGLTFKNAGLKASELGDVLLLAAQIDGGIRINPSNHIIDESNVLFMICRHIQIANAFAKNNDAGVDTWAAKFRRNRKRGQFGKTHHSKFVCMRTEEQVELMYAASMGNGDAGENSKSTVLTPSPTRVNSGASYGGGGSHGGGVPGGASRTCLISSGETVESGDGEVRGVLIGAEDLGGSLDSVHSNASNRRGSFGSDRDGVSPSQKKLNKNYSHRAVNVVKARQETVHNNVRNIKMNATKQDIDQLRKQVKVGGHTVIIMLEDHDELDQQTTWDQLSAIVNSLIFAKDNTPMVVIHPFNALKSRCLFMKKYASQLDKVKMLYCVGDVLDPTTLQGAGCHTCTRILTLAPSAPRMEKSEFDGAELVIRSDEKKDENNILLMMLLEEYKTVWNIKNTHVIFDWYSPSAMNLLPTPRLTEHVMRRISNGPGLHFQLPPLHTTGNSTNKSQSVPSSLKSVGFNTINESKREGSARHTSRDISPNTHSRNSESFDSSSSGSSFTSKLKAGSHANTKFTVSLPRLPDISPSKAKQVSPLISQTGAEQQSRGGDNIDHLPFIQKRSSMAEYISTFEQNPKLFREKKRRRRSTQHPRSAKSLLESFSSSFSGSSREEKQLMDDSRSESEGEEMSEDDLTFASAYPRANCLFAAGYSIPKSFIAALSSMAYYTPGFLELIEALLNPAEYDQTSIPFLIKIPDRFVGKEYRTVAHELQMEGALPLGLLRPGGIDAGTPYPYVVTLVPSSTIVLVGEDRVYLLSTPSWIQTEAIKLGFVSPYHKLLTKKVTSVFAESPINRSPTRPNSEKSSFGFDQTLTKKELGTT